MTNMGDLEDTLHHRMRTATQGVLADAELQRRLIDSASSGRAPVGPLALHRFPTAWVLPAAAAVITVGCVGSVLAIRELAADPAPVPGNGSVLSTAAPTTTGSPSTSAAPTLPTVAPTTSPAASSPHHPVPPPAPGTSSSQAQHTSASNHPNTSESSTSASAPPTNKAPSFPQACAAKPVGIYEAPRQHDFVQHIVGIWLACSTPSVLGGDEIGLEISRDGHWTKLYRNEAGQLVPGNGWGEEGTWTVTDDSDMNGYPTYQLNLRIDGRGTVFAPATFNGDATRVRLDNNEVFVTDYVRP